MTFFALARERGEAPFIILADGLNDPHNLGGDYPDRGMRAGAHGVIIPKRHSAGLTYAVGKASTGAVEHLPVVRVPNLASTVEELQARGVWIYAADMDGQRWCDTDFHGAVGLVIGSREEGRPSHKRKIRFYCFSSDLWEDQFIERLCGMRRAVL